MRCIETVFVFQVPSVRVLINNNMRCIETAKAKSYQDTMSMINNNMRCIETLKGDLGDVSEQR